MVPIERRSASRRSIRNEREVQSDLRQGEPIERRSDGRTARCESAVDTAAPAEKWTTARQRLRNRSASAWRGCPLHRLRLENPSGFPQCPQRLPLDLIFRREREEEEILVDAF